jgi:hypothetical protein
MFVAPGNNPPFDHVKIATPATATLSPATGAKLAETGMDKNMAGLIGAMGALAASAPSQAATAAPLNAQALLHASSYADLLRPIPNARSLLAAVDDERNDTDEGSAKVLQVQDVPVDHHHHHHHHHRRRHHHPVVLLPPPPPPIAHHHHHHNHATSAMGAARAWPLAAARDIT